MFHFIKSGTFWCIVGIFLIVGGMMTYSVSVSKRRDGRIDQMETAPCETFKNWKMSDVPFRCF